MKLLTKEQLESYENIEICYICQEKFENKYLKYKKYYKDRDHCHYTWKYRGAAHSICNLKYSVPKKNSIVFHNGSNYDYHFIINEQEKEFEKQFTCLGESNEKCKTFTVLMEKEVTRTDKMEKKLSYRLQIIASARIMTSSLSNLVNNLSEGIHRIKCKYRHDYKKCETSGIKYKYCDCFLEHTNFKDDLIEYKCLFCCNKNYKHNLDEKLRE